MHGASDEHKFRWNEQIFSYRIVGRRRYLARLCVASLQAEEARSRDPNASITPRVLEQPGNLIVFSYSQRKEIFQTTGFLKSPYVSKLCDSMTVQSIQVL
jgi:hypothetical protein